MPKGGTSIHCEADDYRAKVPGVRMDLVFPRGGEFRGRLTWLTLGHLHLFESEENLPRISYVSLTQERVGVAFPMRPGPPQFWGGLKLAPGDAVIHGCGAHMYQRTLAASRWGSVSLAPHHLAAYGRALAGFDLVLPPVGTVLRLSSSAAGPLIRLHAQACGLDQSNPDRIAHREVARALEQNLIHALVKSLLNNKAPRIETPARNQPGIMSKFEEVLTADSRQPLRVPDICAALGMPERVLRRHCAAVLGMGPGSYLRLRRLNLVRARLRHPNSEAVTVTEIARGCGFSELGRFAAAYRAIFGEMPSTTLGRSKSVSPKVNSAESA